MDAGRARRGVVLATVRDAPYFAASVDPVMTALAALAWVLGGTGLWAGLRWVRRRRSGLS